jgi:hypothetical protein
MLDYYFRLALVSLRRHWTLTVLMVVAIAVGVALTMTAYTVLSVMSRDTIPWKSSQLFAVQLARMSNFVIGGSCLCGAVTFEVNPPTSKFVYCHCSRCRKATGDAHALGVGAAANYFASSPHATALVWMFSLAWMGTGCLLNARRCHRLHCYISGPAFFLGAVALALLTGGIQLLGPHSLNNIVSITLTVALLSFVPE